MNQPQCQRQQLLNVLLTLLMIACMTAVAQSERPEVCVSATNTYTVHVDIFASERGYYVFVECGLDWINPPIGMEYGETYTFVQEDRSNFWHPLDFSYFPDAHHVGADLLDPRVDGNLGEIAVAASGTTSSEAIAQAAGDDSCASNMTCPSPMYYLNDGYLGSYSNIPESMPATVNQADVGLNMYEDFFFKSMPAWKGYGKFSIKLKFDDEAYTKDIFYYCRIHQFMAGRIKLLKNGVPVNKKDDPAAYYEQETPGVFDERCGTYGLDQFQLPHPECPARFVCDVDDNMREFASCIDAMDCHMMTGMTTKVSSKTELALFLHQMIPHHQNAVNMAKALIKAGFLPCDDLTDEEDPYCTMTSLLFGIVARQNHEIGVMNNVLAAMNLPPRDDCEVLIPQEHESSRALSSLTGAAAGALFGAAAQVF